MIPRYFLEILNRRAEIMSVSVDGDAEITLLGDGILRIGQSDTTVLIEGRNLHVLRAALRRGLITEIVEGDFVPALARLGCLTRVPYVDFVAVLATTEYHRQCDVIRVAQEAMV